MADFVKRTSWHWSDWIAAIITLMGIGLWFASPHIGGLEGRTNPVATLFEIEVVEDRRVATAVTGTFQIDRPGCDFQRIEWYLVGASREVLIDLEFEEGTRVRDGGFQEFGPWVLSIRPEQLERTRADVIHQCPFRPWLTRTPLFP